MAVKDVGCKCADCTGLGWGSSGGMLRTPSGSRFPKMLVIL